MGTKSYVKPICDPRVLSHLSVGLCVNTNEIQSPCGFSDFVGADVVRIKRSVGELQRLEKDAYETLSEKDKKILDEIAENCDDSHDDH